MITDPIVVRLVRTFPAPPARIFECFLRPEDLRRWFLTTEATNKSVTNRPYVGGDWEIVDVRDGIEYRSIGHYLELEADSRLVFTLQLPQLSESVDTIEIDLRAVDEGTELIFTQHLPPSERSIDDERAGATRVWDTLLKRLRAVIDD